MKRIFLLRLYYELWKINKLSLYKKLVQQFEDLTFHKGKMVLYRGVGLEIEPNTNLGICWTFNYDKAYPYNGKGTPYKFYFIYHALIPMKGINWKRTIEVNSNGFTYEKEIRLQFQQPIYVLQCDKIIILPCYSDGKKWQFPKEVHSVKYKFTKFLS